MGRDETSEVSRGHIEEPCILIQCIFTFAIKHLKSLDAKVSGAEFGLVWKRNCEFKNECSRQCNVFVLSKSVDNQTSCP